MDELEIKCNSDFRPIIGNVQELDDLMQYLKKYSDRKLIDEMIDAKVLTFINN